jgi:hypothetical protein
LRAEAAAGGEREGLMSGARQARDMRIRLILIAVAIPALLLGLGFIVNLPQVTAGWPFPVTRLTHLFLAAVSFAFAAPVLWAAWTWDFAGVAGVGLTVAVSYALFSLIIVTLIGPNQGIWLNLVLAIAVALIGFGGFVFGANREPKDRRVTPMWVRALFGVFAALLILSGGAMMLRVANILPWAVDPESAQLVGALFVGNSAIFLWAIARPVWTHATAAWLAFIVYDIFLVLPLVTHLSDVLPEHTLGLWLYLGVLVVSFVGGVYALFIDPKTRIMGAPAPPPPSKRAARRAEKGR